MTPKQILLSLRMIFFAMLIGQLLFLTIVFILRSQGVDFGFEDLVNPLLVIVLLVSAISVIVGKQVFNKKIERAKNQKTLLQKLEAYRVAFIVRLAFVECAVLLALIIFMLTSSYYFSGIAVILILLFMTFQPSKSSVSMSLELSLDEQSEL